MFVGEELAKVNTWSQAMYQAGTDQDRRCPVGISMDCFLIITHYSRETTIAPYCRFGVR